MRQGGRAALPFNKLNSGDPIMPPASSVPALPSQCPSKAISKRAGSVARAQAQTSWCAKQQHVNAQTQKSKRQCCRYTPGQSIGDDFLEHASNYHILLSPLILQISVRGTAKAEDSIVPSLQNQ